MDIIICKIKYNDKYNELPHQHFVGIYTNEFIDLYVITSKTYKNNYIKENIEKFYIFNSVEKIEFNLKLESYIDCSVCYRLELDNSIDLTKLDNRYINNNFIKNKINNKILALKNLIYIK